MDIAEVRLTVAELKEILAHLPEETEISFRTVDGRQPLQFHRLRGNGQGATLELNALALSTERASSPAKIIRYSQAG
jgi:hypothetical protein